MRDQVRALWAIVKKDLAVWVRSPVILAVTLLPSLVLILVLMLEAAAVTAAPVAVVNLDPHGRAAAALAGSAIRFDGFRAETLTAVQAQRTYADLRVAAVLTIPAGFSRKLQERRAPQMLWQVRNFNDDTANDLRRGLPDVVNAFLASGAAGADPVRIGILAHNLHPRDANFVAFELVAVLAVLILQAGMVNAGIAAVREWETGSVKELLLSPASSLTIVAGKVLAGVIAADLASMAAVALAAVLGILPRPSPAGASLAIAAMTLMAVFASGVGVALGAWLRAMERLNSVSILVGFYLFFLSGGVAAVAYLPAWLRAVARWIPNTYAVDALRGGLLYGSSQGSGGDLLALGIAAVLALGLGIPALRRGLAH